MSINLDAMPVFLATGDFNGDGKPDAAVTTALVGDVAALLNANK
jgi:hypothetical protein